jgi:membrane associated rhomboid family serine protease
MNFYLHSFPKGILSIIVVSVVIWIMQIIPYFGNFITEWFSLIPFRAFGNFEIWRFFTYLFLHDPYSPFHILFNMLTLWMFGAELEEIWGRKKFVAFYLLSGALAGVFSFFTILKPILWFQTIIGASGAVLALLTVYAFYFPTRKILLFFLFPVNVIVAVAIFGIISLFFSMQTSGNVSHITHLGGIIIGALFSKKINFGKIFKRRTNITFVPKKNDSIKKNNLSNNEYFEKVIDPILKKISEKGMNSLTEYEKALLEEASKRKQRKIKDSTDKIIPFK